MHHSVRKVDRFLSDGESDEGRSSYESSPEPEHRWDCHSQYSLYFDMMSESPHRHVGRDVLDLSVDVRSPSKCLQRQKSFDDADGSFCGKQEYRMASLKAIPNSFSATQTVDSSHVQYFHRPAVGFVEHSSQLVYSVTENYARRIDHTSPIYTLVGNTALVSKADQQIGADGFKAQRKISFDHFDQASETLNNDIPNQIRNEEPIDYSQLSTRTRNQRLSLGSSVQEDGGDHGRLKIRRTTSDPCIPPNYADEVPCDAKTVDEPTIFTGKRIPTSKSQETILPSSDAREEPSKNPQSMPSLADSKFSRSEINEKSPSLSPKSPYKNGVYHPKLKYLVAGINIPKDDDCNDRKIESQEPHYTETSTEPPRDTFDREVKHNVAPVQQPVKDVPEYDLTEKMPISPEHVYTTTQHFSLAAAPTLPYSNASYVHCVETAFPNVPFPYPPSPPHITSNIHPPRSLSPATLHDRKLALLLAASSARMRETLDSHACDVCGKRYSTSSNLARHRQIHRSVCDKKARKCPHCEKVYVSIPAYSMHVRTHNQGCECPHCGKKFSRPWLLQGHIRTHTGEKPFGCPQCGKFFADKSNLRAHIQTHSSDKPYICGRCGKAFALKSYLYKHEESSCMRGQRYKRR